MRFATYQNNVIATDERKKVTISLLGLVSEVGGILSAYKKWVSRVSDAKEFRNELIEELGDVLWYLTSLANLNSVTLDEIAANNSKKILKRFDRGTIRNFDRRLPSYERFPRKFDVKFTESRKGKNATVRLDVCGVHIGDRLTDNTYEDDGYRFHDVFHLAYVAILGWSPVIRALLRRKRKSRHSIDENEDGARAIALEEAITIFVFKRAKHAGFFAGRTSISYGLLRTIQQLVDDLEVSVCTAKQWERAILEGYRMFRLLKANRGGIVSLDLDRARISYARVPAVRRRRRANVRSHRR